MNRTKVTVACQACQKKKVKCTGSAPCTTCSRSGHKCIFSNNAKKRGPRNDDDKIKGGLYPYLVPKKSDVPIKPQRRQDQFEDHQSPFFCRPMPVYPSNMRRDRSDINGYAQIGPLSSHTNISEITSLDVKNNSIKDLTLPPPYSQSAKRKGMSMSVYSSSLGTQLLLPAPDLGMDFLQKSLISSLRNLKNNDENSLEHGSDFNETFNVKEEKESIKVSLPSPPLSSPSSTSYSPPTPNSASSPPLSPTFSTKRSSIHLLSKPAPWHNDCMEIDGSY
ncbi:N-terminal binuclear Zn cluster-containing/DNA binding domain-containing protein [Rhizophagus clarus]|uniref:N-terminal binuclear Zn cluster-containing/DNA binding domain-containing protein n=1 Tax=Rhizophagus clarus TaxID=94130 RepID=A0A8H3QQ36_9GLOM|nr:N-terminal binuclear Zn cluster-containing/DNA binding domain-containing protein [Rhizophagus clarus]